MTVESTRRACAWRPWPHGCGPSAIPIDATTPLVAELFPGGRSNVTYRITDGNGDSVVLRRPPLGHVLPSAHDMAREFRVVSGLNLVDFPVPIAYALCEDHEVIGSPFMVMSYVDGRVIADAEGAASLSADEAGAISAVPRQHAGPAPSGRHRAGRTEPSSDVHAATWPVSSIAGAGSGT